MHNRWSDESNLHQNNLLLVITADPQRSADTSQITDAQMSKHDSRDTRHAISPHHFRVYKYRTRTVRAQVQLQ